MYDRRPRPAEVGARIKQFREELGLTQTEVAESAGMKQSGYSAIERGRTKMPEAATLLRIALALGVSPYVLLWNHDLPAGVERTMARLIDLWHVLSDDGRSKLVAFAEGLIAAGSVRGKPGASRRPSSSTH